VSYCTLTDVIGINPKRIYTVSSTPTIAQVTSFMAQIAAEIDSILQGRGLTTPVTVTPEFVAWLSALNARGAAAMAEQAMFPETRGMMQTSSGAVLWSQYQDGLKFLRTGELPAGTSAVSVQSLPFSFMEQNVGGMDEPHDEGWAQSKFGINKEF
jgi:hypothetical protein